MSSVPDRPLLRAVPALETGYAASLPAARTALVGRVAEIDVIQDALVSGSARLLTLTGPGGVGKTRVAIEAAARLVGHFSGSVLFVSAESVPSPELVVERIVRATGREVLAAQEMLDVAAAELSVQPTVLVVDGLEHVAAVGDALAALVERCPDLVVLATSRRPLRQRGERIIEVEPFAVPSNDGTPALDRVRHNDSVRLFTGIARSVDPTFTLSSENANSVAAICRRLDGLPLALELAAARIRVLAPAELADLLESRLDVLRRTGERQPERHRTLWASIQASYRLLDATDRARFSRAAVFMGGFDAETFAAVTGDDIADILDTVSELDDIHLIRRVPGLGDARRFDLLATVRQFALAELIDAGDEEPARAAHASWCLEVAAPAEEALTGGGNPRATLDRLELEHDNIRAALSWLVDHDPERALRLAAALWRFWWIRGHLKEGRRWLERSLVAATEVSSRARADAEAALADLVTELGEIGYAEELFGRALERYADLGDARAVGRCWNGLGNAARDRAALDLADQFHDRALEIWRAEGDQRGVATALAGRGAVAYYRGDKARAEREWTAALDVTRAIGDLRAAGPMLSNIGAARLDQCDVDGAIAAHEESAAIARDLGDRSNLVQALGNLGGALVEAGADDRAGRVLDDALDLARELGLARNEAVILHTVATLALRAGDVALAASASARGLHIFAEAGMRGAVAEVLVQLGEIAEHAGRSADHDLFAAGDDTTLDRALARSREMAAELSSRPAASAARVAAARRAGLTAREAEIADMLAARRTDPEIAAELFISLRTVTTHVSAILRKLGIASRRDVAGVLSADESPPAG